MPPPRHFTRRDGWWGDFLNALFMRPVWRPNMITTEKLPRITRVTLVGDEGLICERWNQEVSLSWQDDDRTLKVFMTKRSEQ